MEKPEINLEKVHLLIDKLKTQVSDSSGAEHLLSTAQMLVAELQTLQQTHRPRPSVCVVMPSGSGQQRSSNQSVSNNFQSAPKNAELDLQPPVTITEQAPEEVMDQHAFNAPPDNNQAVETGGAISPEQPSFNERKELHQEEQEVEEGSTTAQVNATDQPVASSVASTAPDTTAELPTSIPPDSPEIQPTAADTAAAIEHSTTPQKEPDAVPYRAPAPPSHQQIPADNQSDHTEQEADNHQRAVASAAPVEPTAGIPIPAQEAEIEYGITDSEGKKRQLDFIHENFSAWSDYGIVNEAPTLIQNKVEPVSDTNTQMDLNDQLKEDREEWTHTLQSTPIDNLAAAIGINDRYLFISELFRGDESMYERSILTLNKFQNFDQAHAWSERELRLKLGWDMDNPITRQFEQLVKRRFMKKT